MRTMNLINLFAFDRKLKYPVALITMFFAVFFLVSESVCPAGEGHNKISGVIDHPPLEDTGNHAGKTSTLAMLESAQKPEHGKSPESAPVDQEGAGSDISEPSTASPVQNPATDSQSVTPGPDRQRENGQKVERNVDIPGASPGNVPPEPDLSPPLVKPGRTGGAETSRMIGGTYVYIVKKRESLRMVGAKMGADWRIIARDNHLNPTKRLEPGQKILVDNRRIVPKFVQNGIVINIPDRTLYLFRDNRLERALPVGLGRRQPGKDTDWRTPTGKFSIVCKQKNPTWHVPPSIQK